MRPITPYFGGKWRLSTWIINHFPPHTNYIEPFGGMGSVLLRKPPSFNEIYNDVNGTIVNLFRVLRDERLSTDLIRRLNFTPYARHEYYDAYGELESEDPVIRAWAFIVRCHFSIKRVESGDGKHFDTRLVDKNPARIWANYPDHLIEVVERLKEVIIEERDGIELIEAYSRSFGPETLVYCDPPYVPTTRRTRHGYSYELTKDDHVRLAETIHNSNMSFVISGYPSELYNELYDDFHKISKERPANVGMAKVPTTECLWLSPGVANYHLKRLLAEGWKWL